MHVLTEVLGTLVSLGFVVCFIGSLISDEKKRPISSGHRRFRRVMIAAWFVGLAFSALESFGDFYLPVWVARTFAVFLTVGVIAWARMELQRRTAPATIE